jgi:FAD:protein FMN transferase
MPVSRAHTLVVEFQAMASPCSLQLVGDDDEAMSAAAEAAMGEVRRIEHKYSRYRTDSIVSRINQAAGGDTVEVDPETSSLLHFADQLWQQSEGLFDITSGVLRTAWDFKRATVPSPEILASALGRIGWSKVEMTASTFRLAQKGMEIDLGGFGKEYAADRAAAILKEHGVRQALVNLGGDLHALADPAMQPHTWTVAIQHPRPPEHDPLATTAALQLSHGGLATSGDYERFFELKGKRYCHILNPITGWPVAHFQSVSVVANNTTTAGALATIAMLKGAAATDWLDKQGASYFAINKQGDHCTNGPLPSINFTSTQPETAP